MELARFPIDRLVMSTWAAPARNAATVHSSLGRWANRSYRKSRMALVCVIFSTSTSDRPCIDLCSISGAVGQVVSEWG